MNEQELLKQPLHLEPKYQDYVWGGRRLRPDVPGPTAEAWVIYEGDAIRGGPLAGKTLKEIAEAYPRALLGDRVVAVRGKRFPLLIKLLDCAEWLSIQVHPNDEQARRMEGPDQNGKTEAWFTVDADPGAALLCGVKPGTTKTEFAQAVRTGKIIDWVNRLEMKPGESVLIRAGMVHALGPGLFIYEVQQTSNITYRVWDWDRPATAERPLHIEQSIAVANLDLEPRVVPPQQLHDSQVANLVSCEYFRLQQICAEHQGIEMDTNNETFHALTVLEGNVRLQGPGWELPLRRYESVVVPAACGAYRIQPETPSTLLRSAVD